MFERSFIETSFNATNSRRRWATLVSMALQGMLVAVLILLPLLFTEALPRLATYAAIVPPPPAPPRGNGGGARMAKPVRGNARPDALVAGIREPRAIPTTIATNVADSPAPDLGVGGGTGGNGNGREWGVPNGVEWGLGAVRNVAFVAKPPVLPTAPAMPKRLAVSAGVLEGLLIYRVVPVYPELAQRARISGAVTLRAVISKAGSIENLRMTAGHPLLAQAALDAVRQWRYRPYRLNGEPVEVDTEITVNFNLGH